MKCAICKQETGQGETEYWDGDLAHATCVIAYNCGVDDVIAGFDEMGAGPDVVEENKRQGEEPPTEAEENAEKNSSRKDGEK